MSQLRNTNTLAKAIREHITALDDIRREINDQSPPWELLDPQLMATARFIIEATNRLDHARAYLEQYNRRA